MYASYHVVVVYNEQTSGLPLWDMAICIIKHTLGHFEVSLFPFQGSRLEGVHCILARYRPLYFVMNVTDGLVCKHYIIITSLTDGLVRNRVGPSIEAKRLISQLDQFVAFYIRQL